MYPVPTTNSDVQGRRVRDLLVAHAEVFRKANPKRYAKLEHALRDALLDLAFEHVYFGLSAAKVGSRFWLVPGIGTACISTTGDVFWDPDFAEPLSHGQKAWVWAHELSHNLYGHTWRRHDRDPMLWNVSGDLSINAILRDVFEGSWIQEPPNVLLPERSRWEWAAEKHYDALLQECPPQQPQPDDGEGDGQGGNGSGQGSQRPEDSQAGNGSGQGSELPPLPPLPTQAPGQGCGAIDFGDDDDGSRRDEYEWREISVQSEAIQKQAGKESGNGLCRLSSVPDPKVKWRNVLRKGCALAKACAGKDRKTWRKRGRRSQLYQPVVWPGWIGTNARAAVVIDTSGSMSDKALHQCVSETLAIARESGIPIYLVTHDHGVQWEGWIRPHEKAASIEASLVGRGGTCAREAYARIDNPRAAGCRHGGTGCACARRPIKFDVMIHLTDCYLSWPSWPKSARRILVARIETDKPNVPEGADVIDVDVEDTY